MENKYYIPELSEFCIGFEFEDRYLSCDNKWSEWHKRTINNFINLSTLDRFIYGEFNQQEDIKKYEFRVKYLDEQDIINCGFVESTGIYNVKCYEFKRYRIYKDSSEENHYFINFMSDYFSDKEIQLFAGFIKNKTEFKKLIKQIGIYEK